MLVSMMADISRVKNGDYIIFYLQQSSKIEGKFFGIFRVSDEFPFLDKNGAFLLEKLNKKLTYRVKIEPYEIYENGVTEWEALDEIKNIMSPSQMLWSLIYRKLKGNRGCTMITTYEAERLFHLIRTKNNNKEIKDSCNFSFDLENNLIIKSHKEFKYNGEKEKLNITPRLIEKLENDLSFEVHLQAYIIQNIELNESLNKCLLDTLLLNWIGNEVSCGVGMQRIDILFEAFEKDKIDKKYLMPIELKCKAIDNSITNQMQRYIDWLEQYYIPNKPAILKPVIIATQIKDKNCTLYKNIIDSFNKFNEKNKKHEKLKYVEFELSKNKAHLTFNEINY